MEKIKILNVGTGALGAYFMGRLAQTGRAAISVLLRSDYEAVKKNGFQVFSDKGDFIFHPAGVWHSAAEYPETPDYIVVTSKVLPEIDLPAMIAPALKSPKTVIVLIQNGIGIEDAVAKAFPDHELISTVAYLGATRCAPGTVRQKGTTELKFGKFGGGFSEAGERFAKLFEGTTVKTSFVDNIAYYRWVKLLWNVPYNPVSVLGGGLDTAEMCDRGKTEALCRVMMEEVRLTAESAGLSIPEHLIDDNIEYTRNFPPYKTSMLADYEAGRKLETEAILGNVCRIAAKNGVKVPHLDTVYALLSTVAVKRNR